VGRNPLACDGKSEKPQSRDRLIQIYCDVTIVHCFTMLCLALSVIRPGFVHVSN